MPEAREEKTFNVREVLTIAMKRKWLVVFPIIIVTAIAYGSSFMMTPEYRSSAIIWIDTPSNASRELAEIIGGGGVVREGGEAQRRRLLALENELKSQTFLFQLIRDLNLDKDQAVSHAAAKMRENNPEFSLDQLKYELLVDQLRGQIDLKVVGENQIEIIAESNDPILARDMVNRLAEIMETEKTKYELEKILDNQSFADLQLQKTENDYGKAVDSLTAAKSRLNRMHLPENISSEANRRDIISDIDKAKLEMRDYLDEEQGLRRQLIAFGLEDVRLKYTDTIVELRSDIDHEITTLAGMMEKYVWNEQNVINVNIRLNGSLKLLEIEVADAVEGQFASEPADRRDVLKRYFIVKESRDVTNSKVNQFQLSLDKIDERINLIPRLEAEIAELEGRVADARKYRDAFKSEEATVEILSERVRERTKYKIIEPARVPLAPFWPNKKRILVLGFVLGMVLGGAAVVIAEMVDDSFKRVEEVEQILSLPVLATIPKIDNLKFK
ncbi:MAG: Wzz/FepE/Etk N-terminal domain-containing protein [candidate division Zixibacteria bacterium]|nr:Wzz/FepE/Etk N-terminal domain-containing protein [candidate division Zixibacteria bacterium]